MQSPTIKSDIYVTVFFMASKNKEGFMLEEGLEYGDITDAIFQDEQVAMHMSGKLLLSVPNSLGWEHHLYDGVSLGQLSMDKLTVDQLQDQDTIIVRVKNDRVGGRELLTVMLHGNEKQPVLKSRLKYLCNSYCGYRLVKHDGNDYYRAVYFALFESFIVLDKREMFSQLQERFHNLLSEVHNEGSVPKNKAYTDQTMIYLNYVIRVLEEAADSKRWTTVEEMEADLLDEEYELDLMFVLMLRHLTSHFIIENKHMKLANNGTTSLEDIILEAFPAYSNLKQYCEECINKADAPISGPVADYGCLFYAVNLQGTIALVDKNKEIKLSLTTVGVTCSEDGDEDSGFGKVHLLLRQGKYDILYLNNDIYTASESGMTSPQLGSPAVTSRPQFIDSAAYSHDSRGSEEEKLTGPSRTSNSTSSMTAPVPAPVAAPALVPVTAPAVASETISMETMKARFEALGVVVTDMNAIYEVCQNCKSVEQGIAYYYKNIASRGTSTSLSNPGSESSSASNTAVGSTYLIEEKQTPPTSRVNSGIPRVNSAHSVDNNNLMNSSFRSAIAQSETEAAPDPLAGNDQYIHRQFLALIKMGFDVDQILEAIDVGQCATFDVALGYLRRKMKYAQERGGGGGGGGGLSGTGTTAVTGGDKPKLTVKNPMNMSFSDLRVESEGPEVPTPTNHERDSTPPPPPAAAMVATSVSAGPVTAPIKKPSMWNKLKATPAATESTLASSAPEEAQEQTKKPVGIAKLQGLMQKGALTSKAGVKGGGASLNNAKTMVAKMKAQVALEEELPQPIHGDEYEEEDHEGILPVPDALTRNAVNWVPVGRGIPSGVSNYTPPPMNNGNGMYKQQPMQQPLMNNMSMFQPPQPQVMNGSTMYQQPVQVQMPARPVMHPMAAHSTMYQQQPQMTAPMPMSMAMAPRAAVPRGPARAPRPQVPLPNVNNFSEEQRIIYQKLLGMQQPQGDALRLAAKFTSIDDFCDYMEKQRGPPVPTAPPPQVQPQVVAGAKKGWGTLKMFKAPK